MVIESPGAPDTGPQSTDGEIIEIAQANASGAEPVGHLDQFSTELRGGFFNPTDRQQFARRHKPRLTRRAELRACRN